MKLCQWDNQYANLRTIDLASWLTNSEDDGYVRVSFPNSNKNYYTSSKFVQHITPEFRQMYFDLSLIAITTGDKCNIE